MSAEGRQLYKEALRMKNINAYVMDLLRIIYISIYAGNRSNNYTIRRTRERTQIAGFSLPYFGIIRKDT